MKILVISDTHGELGKAYEVYKSLENIDLILHLGDYKKDADDMAKRLGVKVVGIKGNNDGAKTKKESSAIIETEAGKILIVHGHIEGVYQGVANLYYRALEEGCKAAFFGHTHVPYYEEANGLILLNPGSLTRPRDGSQGSYAIVTTDKTDIKCEIVYYRKKTKRKGGYVSGLLNYSDRF